MQPVDEHAPPHSMKAAAMSGGRWNLIEALFSQLAGVATTVVLARILAPDDFGIIAIVGVATGLMAILTQVGLSAALIQKSELEPGELSTSFWAAVILGVVIAGGGAVLAGPVAAAFDSPDAAPFLALAPLALLFGLTATVPRAILFRALEFRTVSLIVIGSSVVYAIVAVGLAASTDLGVWAVIIAQVVRRFTTLTATLIAARWRPRFVFSLDLIREDLGFTAGYLSGTIGMYLVKNVDYWAVRRTTDDANLGVYYVAYVLPTIIRQRISWAINRIMLPVLSRIRDDRRRFSVAYLNVLRLLAMVTFPTLVGLATVTHVVVPVAFGPGWDDAIYPMAILALGAAIDSLWQTASTLLVTDGKPGLTVVIVAGRLLVVGAGLLVAVQVGGLEAVAVAVLAGALMSAIAGQWLVVRRLDTSFGELWAALLPSLLPTGVMAAAVFGVRRWLEGAVIADIVELIVLVTVGIAVYAMVGFGVHRSAFASAYHDARQLVSPAHNG